MKARPFIKWVGGKRQLLPELVARMPKEFGTYHEPFVGGGALFFEVRPKMAVLSDVNVRLVRTYRGVRDHVDEVVGLLKTYPNDKLFFLVMRGKNIDAGTDAEVAAWFIYLNKTCFNGLYRVNKKGVFNVPFGDFKNPAICDEDNLRACSEALQDTVIENGDFCRVLLRALPGDFVYMDPPYVPLSATSSFTSYTAQGFGLQEQERLRDVARLLKERGAHVLLSNSSAGMVRELYKDFVVEEVMAKRSVNCQGTGRGKIAELLIH